MKRNHNCYVHVVILAMMMVVSQLLSAQDPKEDFVKINEAFLSPTSLIMDIRYAVYAKKTGKTPILEQYGELKQQGSNRYYKLNSIETIEHKDYQLVVNHLEKRMLFTRKFYDSTANSLQRQMSPMDKEFLNMMIKIADTIIYKKESGNLSSYTIRLSGGDSYDEVKIVYNKKTYLIDKMVFVYPDLPTNPNIPNQQIQRVEVNCIGVKTNTKLPQDLFSYSKFIRQGRTQFFPTEAFKHYKMTDLYTTKKMKNSTSKK